MTTPNNYPSPSLSDWKRFVVMLVGADIVRGFQYGFGIGMVFGLTIALVIILVTAG